METKQFGQLIKKLRLEKGMTQEDLAEESGLDVSFISRIERGVREPSLVSILRLSNGLKIKVSEIFTAFENL